MVICGISGLGADERVFNYLTLDCEIIPIKWIGPKRNESIENYALRLSKVIDTNVDFGILGVSFGGLVAVEISKLLNPKLAILISSAETKMDIKILYRIFGKMGLLKLLPTKAFDPPKTIAYSLFGTKNKTLLKQILDDTDLKFAKWAMNQLINWKNEKRINKINGTRDKLIKGRSDVNTVWIKGGEHFMIVDRAEEISKVINQKIANLD